MSKGELLRIEHAFKRYDGAIALNDAWLSVMPGEVLALMGENGAGKSTLGKILAGAVQPDSAEITLNGQSVQITSPIAAQRLGVGMVFQELDLFPHLSVAENIVIGNLRAESGSWVNRRQLAAFCRPYLDQVGLPVDPHQLVATLSIGQMQLVAIARALSFGARLILMDEPTSALSDDAVQVLFRLIRQLRASGVSIIYVSHKMKEIFEIADRITVMRDGKTIGSKLAGETNIDEIIQMMVGRALSADSQTSTHTSGELLLRVQGLTTSRIHDISFDLRRGEILGVAGLVGAGRSEIGAALFGIDKVVSGTHSPSWPRVDSPQPERSHSRRIGLAARGPQAARLDDADERAGEQHHGDARTIPILRFSEAPAGKASRKLDRTRAGVAGRFGQNECSRSERGQSAEGSPGEMVAGGPGGSVFG
jgi:ribose transport system ATP-binding protein